MLQQKIIRIGNSIGVTIPIKVAKFLDIERGDTVEIQRYGANILIKKVREEE